MESQVQGFLNFTMSCWFKLWEQDVQRDLIPREDTDRYFTEFLLEGLLRTDTAVRGEFYSKMFGIGAFSPNDILEKVNMNGYEGGNEHFMPLNRMPVGRQKTSKSILESDQAKD